MATIPNIVVPPYHRARIIMAFSKEELLVRIRDSDGWSQFGETQWLRTVDHITCAAIVIKPMPTNN